MKYDRFFEYAKEAGLEEAQLYVSRSETFEFALFHKELDSYSVSTSISLWASGVKDGHIAFSTSEKDDEEGYREMVDAIVRSTALLEKPDEVGLFEGSDHYVSKKVRNPALAKTTPEEKIALAKKLEELLFQEEGVADVAEVFYSESDDTVLFMNSHGLRLRSAGNSFIIGGYVTGKDGEKTIDTGDSFFGNDLRAFDPADLARKVGDDLRKRMGASSMKSGVYPTIIQNKVLPSFIRAFIGALSAESVQKKTSPLAGKLGERILSSKVTIEERPLDKTVFFSGFDDEGVAKENRKLIEKGTLLTYLHNRETAKKDGVTTTGNAGYGGGSIGIGAGLIRLRKGKGTLEDLASKVSHGVYITSIAGLGTGLNPYNGDFSCQAQGFEIVDGKIGRPLTLITLSGNLFKMLKDCAALDANMVLTTRKVECPDILIKGMSIAGE